MIFLSSTLYALCIETKRNIVNQNKGKSEFSCELTFWFISIENGGKQKSKNILRVEINQFFDLMVKEVLMPQTQCEELSYSTHFLKSRDSVIRNNFLEYRTKQVTLFAGQNDFYAFFATNKAKHTHNRHFSSPCSDTIYSKSKLVSFLKVYHFSIIQHFTNVNV